MSENDKRLSAVVHDKGEINIIAHEIFMKNSSTQKQGKFDSLAAKQELKRAY